MVYPDVTFSSDGRKLAYRVLRNEQMAAVVEGKTEPLQDRIGKMLFSPDGGHFFYQGIKTILGGRFDGSVVFLDGAPWGGAGAFNRPFGVYSIVFSPDSARVAMGSDGVVYVDGIKGKGFTSVTPPAFSADGSHVAYVGFGEAAHVVVDGALGGPNNTVALIGGSGVAFDGNDVVRYLAVRSLPSKKLGLFSVEARIK
jgi:hypothetical protein